MYAIPIYRFTIFRAAISKPTALNIPTRRNMSTVIDSIKTTLSENLGGVAQKVAPAGTQFALNDVPDQTGKTAVITGGSEGTGLNTEHSSLTTVSFI
jgi:hypothetical protein